jgi:acyl-coenzyme A thioesterase PaaI-like protein
MPVHAETFIADLGFGQRLEGDAMVGEVEITDAVRVPGTAVVRPSVLATVADIAAGSLATRDTFPKPALTVDLTVRSLGPVEGGRLAFAARIVKFGRTTIVGEAWFSEPGCERPVVVSHATFTPSPRPEDLIEAVPSDRLFGPGGMTRPFAESVGARVVEPGVVEVDRRPYVMQPWGTVQGGVIALLGELAAESLMGGAVIDLDVRYLSAVRVGPARTSATAVGGSTVRVEVRDAGSDERLAALVVARTRPTSAA